MIVVAFDPGQTTGYAILSYGADLRHKMVGGFQLEEAGQMLWEHRFVLTEALFKSVTTGHGHHQVGAVVIERFFLYGHKSRQQVGSEFPSSQMVGTIETFMYLYGLSNAVFQNASDIAKTAIRPEHIYKLETEHSRDAYKHARLWLIKQGMEVPINA